MTAIATVSALRQYAAEIRAHGVTALNLYGSIARGEMGPASDVDLFVDYNPEAFSRPPHC